jgi:DMSO/TMAO reductase YedYZ molybdopterin-dependent catalytic subunit
MMSEEMEIESLQRNDATVPPRTITFADGALLGALSSVGVMALNYVIELLAVLPFVPFDILDWLARVLPGNIITAGIDFLVLILQSLGLGPTDRLAKAAERGFALFQFVLIGAALGLLLVALNRRVRTGFIMMGVVGGIVLGIGAIVIRLGSTLLSNYYAIEAIWVMAVFIFLGAGIGYLLQTLARIKLQTGEIDLTRRSFFYWVGGVVFATALGSIGLNELFSGEESDPVADAPLDFDPADTSGMASSPSEAELANRFDPAPGTRPEITSNESFYTIDINANFKPLDEGSWKLELGGLVQNPLSLSIADLRSRPSVTQVITLQCISNRVGGDLTGTAKWTGVPLVDLLDEAGLLPEVKELAIEAADGFYESVSMMDIQDQRTLLVYEMNGEPLPHEHGYPLRIYIPNRYGMKQPKWITRINAIDFEGPGYWVDRGWSEEAFVVTTSVVDTDDSQSGLVEGDLFPVGGIAYSGAKGISKVEVRVDDGEWVEAQLRVPPLSPLTWVQWRYDWPVSSGTHTFHVHAYDGDGNLQIQSIRPVRPDGATGIHSQKIRF